MNLIACEKDCFYQKDGYCTASGSAPLSRDGTDGCCYYIRRSPGLPPPPFSAGGTVEQKNS